MNNKGNAKLTIKFAGSVNYIRGLSDGVEIEFDPKLLDLWQDQIEMWLEISDKQDYAKFRIKNDKMTEFKKS